MTTETPPATLGLDPVAAHHWIHGAYSQLPGETRSEGRLRCALRAAHDEARLRQYVQFGDMVVGVEPDEWPSEGDADPDVLADMLEGLESGRYVYVTTSIMSSDGYVLESLGGTCTAAGDLATDSDGIPSGYLRTVAVEMFLPAFSALADLKGWAECEGEPEVVPCTCEFFSPKLAQCGTCGFIWCARCHPVPSARTPCEYEHVAAVVEAKCADDFRPAFEEGVASKFGALLAYVADDLGAPSFAADLACKGANARALDLMADRWDAGDFDPTHFAETLRELAGAFDGKVEDGSDAAFDWMTSQGLECRVGNGGGLFVALSDDQVLGPFGSWSEAMRNPLINPEA